MSMSAMSVPARARIATDHALLRGLGDELRRAAEAARRDEKERFRIRTLLAQLAEEAERHFAYEESVLGHLRGRDDARMRERVAQDHAQQRQILLALAEDAGDGARGIMDLTDEILWFLTCFERDMTIEEEAIVEDTSVFAS